MITTILLIFAFVLALIEACWPLLMRQAGTRPHLGWLAFAVYLLSIILGSRV